MGKISKIIIAFIFILIGATILNANWKFNPYTGKQDYYEVSSPTTTTLPWSSITATPPDIRLAQPSMAGGGNMSWSTLTNRSFIWDGTFIVSSGSYTYAITQPTVYDPPPNYLGGATGPASWSLGAYLNPSTWLIYSLPTDTNAYDPTRFYITDTLDPAIIPANSVIIAKTDDSNIDGSSSVITGVGRTLGWGITENSELGYAKINGDLQVAFYAQLLTLNLTTNHITPFLWANNIFADFVVSGGLANTWINLTDQAAFDVVAYYGGSRVVGHYDAGSHTYTASVDTYIDIDAASVLYFSEVANGDPAPDVLGLRLCKVVTSATAITSVMRVGAQLMPFNVDANGVMWTTQPAMMSGLTSSATVTTIGVVISSPTVTGTTWRGPELVTNGTFSGNATGWTLATGWTYTNNTISHSAAGTGTAAQLVSGFTVSAMYQVIVQQVSNTTSTRSFKTTLFGVILGTETSAATFTYNILATAATSTLSFTPMNTAYRGVLDNISIKEARGGDLTMYGNLIMPGTGGSATGSMACWKTGNVMGYCDLNTECATTCH